MSEYSATYQAPYLPPDIARCPGVGYPDEDGDGEIGWREGCEHCLRRLAPIESEHTEMIEPPPIIAFNCPYEIPAGGDD